MEHEKSLPNIIFFVADELRGDCISLEGKRNPKIKILIGNGRGKYKF